MQKLSAKRIAYYGLLIALNVVLTRVGSIRIGGGGVEIVRIGFGGYPVIFAGMVFGPAAGGIIGAVGDIIGHIMSPMGPYMPHFTINAALTGILPGLLIMMFRSKESRTSFWRILLVIGVTQIVTSIIIWSFLMNILFSMPLAAILPTRIVSQLINIVLYAYITKVLMTRLPIALDLN